MDAELGYSHPPAQAPAAALLSTRVCVGTLEDFGLDPGKCVSIEHTVSSGLLRALLLSYGEASSF